MREKESRNRILDAAFGTIVGITKFVYLEESRNFEFIFSSTRQH
jgi:hypothetical protein